MNLWGIQQSYIQTIAVMNSAFNWLNIECENKFYIKGYDKGEDTSRRAMRNPAYLCWEGWGSSCRGGSTYAERGWSTVSLGRNSIPDGGKSDDKVLLRVVLKRISFIQSTMKKNLNFCWKPRAIFIFRLLMFLFDLFFYQVSENMLCYTSFPPPYWVSSLQKT